MNVLSNQSLILAAKYPSPRAKSGSVFAAVLGPAPNRETPKGLTIVGASPGIVLTDGGDLTGATRHPRATELYSQTQRILNQVSRRSVHLDVHA